LSDIFLSYASEDLERIKPLANALQAQGWTVFYDRTIPPGKTWRQVIGKHLDECHCIVVAWSTYSVDSHWVCEEADIGREENRLIPIKLDDVKSQLGFRSIQSADLTGWRGDTQAFGYLALCEQLSEHLGQVDSSTKSTKTASPLIYTASLIEPDMVRLPAGIFNMGSNNREEYEKPLHTVRLKSFAIARYPVTFDEYDQFVLDSSDQDLPDDKGWGRGKRPVINVSWNDAMAYANWLKAKTGKPYRLPTEAEWEYAARAGTSSDYYWGQGNIKDFAWFTENSGGKTQPVGEKKPNAFDLHDMSGNVWEWVQDHWHENYDHAPGDGTAWLTDKDSSSRVLRGGSWFDIARYLRSADRHKLTLDSCFSYVGFRLAQN
jgi:formylglycine-generating enzyme required for sulfatase activity